jgi:hypothetical protein
MLLNKKRCYTLIKRSIAKFNLNLTNLTVLTEAATGYYTLTPLIAALSGAERVFAITKDSPFGEKKTISENTYNLADEWGVKGKIEILFSKKDKKITHADIVTNLGFVRPINKELISLLKKTVVIPLMFETWEYRENDIDLHECKSQGIPVLGTDESYPGLDIFSYIGPLAIKLAFELDVEVIHNNIIVVGGGVFGRNTVKAFNNLGAEVTKVQINRGESLGDEHVLKAIRNSDLIVFVEHESREMLLGSKGQLSIKELCQINPAISIVHITGVIDHNEIKRSNITYRPDKLGQQGHMSVATDYLGPKPLIDLHTAGLKVGEAMARARKKGYSMEKVIRIALKSSPAQDFENI